MTVAFQEQRTAVPMRESVAQLLVDGSITTERFGINIFFKEEGYRVCLSDILRFQRP